jgi:Zn-dependent metalloprotease
VYGGSARGIGTYLERFRVKIPDYFCLGTYVETDQDNGGVHINSGIPNRAFFLAADGFGGYAWDKAGPIWYTTLLDPGLKSRPSATFPYFAQLTVANAGKLFGTEGTKVVTEAWHTVGVL